MIIYRYLPTESAVKTIEGHAFRVSRIRELNDPFEWVPGLDPVQPHAIDLARCCMDRFLAEVNDTFGIIAFSRAIHDPVLWSHYANSHCGIAFEIDNYFAKNLRRVKYTKDRLVIDPRWIHDPQKEQQLANTFMQFWRRKSVGWAYEKEWRVWLELKNCKTANGMFFHDIPRDSLRRVILGAHCPIGLAYIQRVLELNGYGATKSIQATKDNKTYTIIC